MALGQAISQRSHIHQISVLAQRSSVAVEKQPISLTEVDSRQSCQPIPTQFLAARYRPEGCKPTIFYTLRHRRVHLPAVFRAQIHAARGINHAGIKGICQRGKIRELSLWSVRQSAPSSRTCGRSSRRLCPARKLQRSYPCQRFKAVRHNVSKVRSESIFYHSVLSDPPERGSSNSSMNRSVTRLTVLSEIPVHIATRSRGLNIASICGISAIMTPRRCAVCILHLVFEEMIRELDRSREVEFLFGCLKRVKRVSRKWELIGVEPRKP